MNSRWKYLLFDLDNTLYSDDSGLLSTIDRRITDFLVVRLGMDREAVDRLRNKYWRDYGTTLRGVKEQHGIAPNDYIAHAYDVDVTEYLRPDPDLRRLLQGLPWTKAVFSNSPACHVRKVLAALGVADCFERVFSIEYYGHRGKPDPIVYRRILADLDLSGPDCVMIDDSSVNLIPANALGMITVFLGAPRPAWADYAVPNVCDLDRILLQDQPGEGVFSIERK